MIGYRLCKVKTANHPFYLESISVNLYSVEELCYFLYHNPFLIDEDIVSTKLTRWIAEELGMPETGLQMERAMRGKNGLSECILPVFQNTGYLSAQEMAEYRKVLDTLGSVSAAERLKRKGDALAQNGKYAAAIAIYRRAMTAKYEGKDKERKRKYLAVLWHNIGVVNMQLFEFEEGMDAFSRAWEYGRDESSALCYLTALRLAVPDEAYKTKAAEFLENSDEKEEILHRVDSVLEAAKEKASAVVKNESEEAADQEGMDAGSIRKRLEKIAEEYHSFAGT